MKSGVNVAGGGAFTVCRANSHGSPLAGIIAGRRLGAEGRAARDSVPHYAS